MNCPICGAVLNDGAKFCGNCGNKVEIAAAPAAPAAETPVMPAAPVAPIAPAEQLTASIFDQPAAPQQQPVPETPVQPVNTASVQGAFAQPDQQIYTQPQAGGGYGGNNYIQNNYTQENLNPPVVKKKGKGVLIAVLVVFALLIVGIGVTLFIFRGSLKNTWARLTKSPDEYLKYVISESMEESLDGMEDLQKEYSEMLAKMDDINMQGSLRVQMNDELLDTLEDASASLLANSRYGSMSYDSDYYDYYDDYYDTDMYDKYDTYDDYYQAEHASKGSGGNGLNLSAYGDITLNGSYDRKGNLMGVNAGIQVKGGSDVIGVDAVYDGDNYTVYGRIPQLNKDYIMIDLSNVLDKNQQKDLDKVLSATADFSSASMDPKMVRDMYNRYIMAVLKPIEKVEASKVKLPVNGTKMSCRAYEFTLDDDLFQEMVLAVIDEIKDDRDLGKWFDDYMDNLDFGQSSASKPDWDKFLDQLEDAEKDVKNIKFDEVFKCAFYITDSGKITGFSILGEDDKDPHFSYAWNYNKNKLDIELTSDYTDKNDKTQFLDIKGGGTVKSGKFTGDFVLDFSALDDKVDFSLEDVEIEDKKNPGGTFRIGLEQFMKMAEDKTDAIPDCIKKADLVISFSGTIKDNTFSIGLENGSQDVIKLTTNAKISDSQGIAVPSSKESVEINEGNADTEMVKYLKDSDLEKVVSGLETLGLPDSYADQIRQVTKMLDYY